ncbi:MAG: mono/diheme cytochrome c family protein [Myxococcota bacterium]|jgi:mono/diheme cytochrome c family protein
MNLLLLATEATGEATDAAEAVGSSGASLAVWLGIGLLALFAIAFVVVGPGKTSGPKTRGDIPLAMRPYHSDEELETTGLERAMSWAVALALFIAVFIPLYWIVEPDRIEQKKDEFYNEDIELGRALYAANCTTCHGVNAEGGVAPHPDPNVSAPWPAPQLNNIAARYADSEIVSDLDGFIYLTLDQGRPGSPMPAWGSRYSGPMNDQELQVITTYLLAIQTGELVAPDAQAFVGQSGEELYQNNCARCHGADANGRVGPNLRIMFDQFGANSGANAVAVAASTEQARLAVRYILNNGLYVPTGAPMPSFANVLTEDALEVLLDYLASIQVTVEEAGLTGLIGQQGRVPQPSDAAITATTAEG